MFGLADRGNKSKVNSVPGNVLMLLNEPNFAIRQNLQTTGKLNETNEPRSALISKHDHL